MWEDLDKNLQHVTSLGFINMDPIKQMNQNTSKGWSDEYIRTRFPCSEKFQFLFVKCTKKMCSCVHATQVYSWQSHSTKHSFSTCPKILYLKFPNWRFLSGSMDWRWLLAVCLKINKKWKFPNCKSSCYKSRRHSQRLEFGGACVNSSTGKGEKHSEGFYSLYV